MLLCNNSGASTKRDHNREKILDQGASDGANQVRVTADKR